MNVKFHMKKSIVTTRNIVLKTILILTTLFIGFQQSSTLKEHIRIHSGESPYLCSECGKVFNNNGNLRQHMLRHRDTKQFVCTECPSKFISKGKFRTCIAISGDLCTFFVQGNLNHT